MVANYKESDLYGPVKTLFENQGYVVKSEIGSADVVAVREKEDPVIVELKTGFSLTLVHQAIERQKITDAVYVAIPHKAGRNAHKALINTKALCRRLCIGLITVRLTDQFVQVLLDPTPYKPRLSSRRKTNLLKEFHNRVGDPNIGGTTRRKLVTAYRQDALRCLRFIEINGSSKASIVAHCTSVPKARNIMADNHYGWFERVERGIYAITPLGKEALATYQEAQH